MTINSNVQYKKVQTASGASAGGFGGVTVIAVASALGVSIFCIMAIIITISAVLCLIKKGTYIYKYHDTSPVY